MAAPIPPNMNIFTFFGAQVGLSFIQSYFTRWAFSGIAEDITNIDFANTLRGFNKENALKMAEFSHTLGDGIGKSVANFNATAAWSALSNWGPTIVAMGAAYYGLPLAYKYAYKVLEHRIGRPSMAMDVRATRWYTPLMNCFRSKAKETEAPVFSEKMEAQIKDIVTPTKNIVKNKGVFENVVLYGPPGTGKTMLARKMAEDSDMDYYMISGAELAPFIKRGEHVMETNRLLDRAENSGKPSIIFIDECDAIFGKRDELDQPHIEIQNAILARTGRGSNKIMLVGASNRKNVLDPAFLSRATHKIHVGPPELSERVKILNLYAERFFTPEERQEFFTPTAVLQIVQKIDGFTGRAIFQMMNSIYNKKFSTDDGKLTPEIIAQKVDQFIQQAKELGELFGETEAS